MHLYHRHIPLDSSCFSVPSGDNLSNGPKLQLLGTLKRFVSRTPFCRDQHLMEKHMQRPLWGIGPFKDLVHCLGCVIPGFGSSKCVLNLCVFFSPEKKTTQKAGFILHIWKIQVWGPLLGSSKIVLFLAILGWMTSLARNFTMQKSVVVRGLFQWKWWESSSFCCRFHPKILQKTDK